MILGYQKCRRSRDKRPETTTEIIVLGYHNIVDHEASSQEPLPKSLLLTTRMSWITRQAAGNRHPTHGFGLPKGCEISLITSQAAGNTCSFLILKYQKCRGSQDKQPATTAEISDLGYHKIVDHEAGGQEPLPKSLVLITQMS